MPERLKRARGRTSPRTGSCQGSTDALIWKAIIGVTVHSVTSPRAPASFPTLLLRYPGHGSLRSGRTKRAPGDETGVVDRVGRTGRGTGKRFQVIDAEGTGPGRGPDRPVAVRGCIGGQPRHPTVRIDGGGKAEGVAGQRPEVGDAVRPRAGGRPDGGTVDGAVRGGGVS